MLNALLAIITALHLHPSPEPSKLQTTGTAVSYVPDQLMNFEYLNLDALLDAPVFDAGQSRIGYISEIVIAPNGDVTGLIVSEFALFPFLGRTRELNDGAYRLQIVGASEMVVHAQL
ncbi:hypothetical protein [Pseudoprimorskyibacter insulae]|uniref:PRC-barrel domain-containing protein n=1 Tax=Pseudoprimorskyibacter insulae TaxID=1695997 RepID=A0A2R8AU47_9RHOB|nr:hypothetical protein [Pseudoprimorskyibacter insulae]SPF79558.1 hypothetical protein PRI8871_01354 [Pseudoprimorskyibacter insulae]